MNAGRHRHTHDVADDPVEQRPADWRLGRDLAKATLAWADQGVGELLVLVQIPNDDALGAIFDRFLVRAASDNLDSFHFHGFRFEVVRRERHQLTLLRIRPDDHAPAEAEWV